MRSKNGISILLTLLIVVGMIAAGTGMAQNTASPSLKDQLEAQFSIAKVQTNGTVLQAGTVLVIQKAGIQAFPPDNALVARNTYKDGELHAPSGKMRGLVKWGDALVKSKQSLTESEARALHVGEKVYVTDIAVNSEKKRDMIDFTIVECDSCNGATQISSYKAQVDFEFAKGALANPSVSQIEDTIGNVFTIDNSTQGTQAQQPQAQPGQPEAQPQPPAQAPAPAQIQLGQSIDDVVAAIGQPEKIVDLGAKKIYVYKDLKITFTNGKVSDVQ